MINTFPPKKDREPLIVMSQVSQVLLKLGKLLLTTMLIRNQLIKNLTMTLPISLIKKLISVKLQRKGFPFRMQSRGLYRNNSNRLLTLLKDQ